MEEAQKAVRKTNLATAKTKPIKADFMEEAQKAVRRMKAIPLTAIKKPMKADVMKEAQKAVCKINPAAATKNIIKADGMKEAVKVVRKTKTIPHGRYLRPAHRPRRHRQWSNRMTNRPRTQVTNRMKALARSQQRMQQHWSNRITNRP